MSATASSFVCGLCAGTGLSPSRTGVMDACPDCARRAEAVWRDHETFRRRAQAADPANSKSPPRAA